MAETHRGDRRQASDLSREGLTLRRAISRMRMAKLRFELRVRAP
jgi:hypothetical protein